MGLAIATMSGFTPNVWKANNEPVRPSPHWISSKISAALKLVGEHAALAAGIPTEHSRMPPSPKMGSSTIAQVSDVDRRTQSFHIILRDKSDVLEQRLEPFAVFLLSGKRHRSKGAPVI